ncbi:MAG: formylmethanofuran dehydrogenase [Desulfobacter sp.]|nr:MAG: formylmethanofuran dehydrogenase [Desulfobacter sp.]
MEPERMNRLKENPRADFNRAVGEKDAACCLVKTAEIHGHYCPGSAFGVMAALTGLAALGAGTSRGMEDLMAVVEINACFADGIQAVSGCTLGNNGLVFQDLGKMAVSFGRRSADTGVRVRVKGHVRDHVDRVMPEFFPLMEKVIRDRAGTPEEEKAFREMGKAAAFKLIQQPFDTFFHTEPIDPDLPPYAPIVPSLVCPGCRETVMASKTVQEGPKKGYCLACAGAPRHWVDGRGIL